MTLFNTRLYLAWSAMLCSTTPLIAQEYATRIQYGPGADGQNLTGPVGQGGDPSLILGAPDHVASTGAGLVNFTASSSDHYGRVTVGFDTFAIDGPGNEIAIHYGNWNSGEDFSVYASQDGASYSYLGSSTGGNPNNASTVKTFDLATGGLSTAHYVRVVNSQKRTSGFEGPDLDAVELLAGSSFIWRPPTEMEPPQPDPENPETVEAQYRYEVGFRGQVDWYPIEVGAGFNLSIPGLDPIAMERTIFEIEDPVTVEFDWSHGFNTNDTWIGKATGKLLSALAPIDERLAEAQGTLGLRGKAELTAGTLLTDGQSQADFDISAAAGLFGYLEADLYVPAVANIPFLADMINRSWEFEAPIPNAGIKADLSVADFTLPFTFDYDQLKAEVAALLDIDPSQIDDEGTEQHYISKIPIIFDPEKRRAGVVLGASAQVFVETTAEATVDFYFYEYTDSGAIANSESLFDAMKDVFTKTVEVTNETIRVSDTGEVTVDAEGVLGLVTGSPVWASTLVQVEEVANIVGFESQFVSEADAEGLLQVYWDGELIATIDERDTGAGWETFLLALPEDAQPGYYDLSIRLDNYTELESSIQIADIHVGYLTPLTPGDADSDGDIDDSDLGTAFSNYTGPLAAGVGDKTFAEGDTDGDGDVDDSDLGTAFSGYTGPLAVNVPEPTSGLMLLMLGSLAARRRRH